MNPQHTSRASGRDNSQISAAEPNEDLAAPPCFFWAWCAQRSAVEKAGRSVCRRCASMLRGFEYPLRMPQADVAEPAYSLPIEDIELIER